MATITELQERAIGEIVAARADSGLPEDWRRRPAEMGVKAQIDTMRIGKKFGTNPDALVSIHIEALQALGVSKETAVALVNLILKEARG